MAYLIIQGRDGINSYGSQYMPDSGMGSARLNIRTGTGANDIVKYGWTTNISASEYSPVQAILKDGVTGYLGRNETSSRSSQYTVTTGTSYKTTSFTTLYTSTLSGAYSSTSAPETTGANTRSSQYTVNSFTGSMPQTTTTYYDTGTRSSSYPVNTTVLNASTTSSKSSYTQVYSSRGASIRTIGTTSPGSTISITYSSLMTYGNGNVVLGELNGLTQSNSQSHSSQYSGRGYYSTCKATSGFTATVYNISNTFVHFISRYSHSTYMTKTIAASRASIYTSNTRYGTKASYYTNITTASRASTSEWRTRSNYSITATTGEVYLTETRSRSSSFSTHNFNI